MDPASLLFGDDLRPKPPTLGPRGELELAEAALDALLNVFFGIYPAHARADSIAQLEVCRSYLERLGSHFAAIRKGRRLDPLRAGDDHRRVIEIAGSVLIEARDHLNVALDRSEPRTCRLLMDNAWNPLAAAVNKLSNDDDLKIAYWNLAKSCRGAAPKIEVSSR